MSTIEQNKAIVRTFVEAVNAQDWKRLEAIIASNFVRHDPMGGKPGVQSCADLVQFLQNEYVTFPDAHETIEDLIAEGDKVAVRHRFQGTQQGWMGAYPPSGKTLTADYIAIYRVQDNQIVEAWAVWDNLNGLKQLGHEISPSVTNKQ
jgi:steroid delta-isomerase-like uncharacterized protein